MIVYRDSTHEQDTSAQLVRLAQLVEQGNAVSFLVELGALEQGVADALAPERDRWGVTEMRLREAAHRAGAAFLASRDGRAPQAHLQCAQAALDTLSSDELPVTVHVKSPEGYMHYALDPAGYALSAEAYRRDVGERRAAQVVVIGVRSIGTSLSAVVAAALGSERSLTVRPRGETGGRHVAADPTLEGRLQELLTDASDVLIVDEGPGATGETLACIAGWLQEQGVAAQRIVLFPHHPVGLSLAPEERRAWFDSVRRYFAPLEEQRPARLAARLGLAEPEDLSGGQWRAVVPGAEAEPAFAMFERRKYRAQDPQGGAYLMRYAGLGRWGEATAARAAALAEAGVGEEVIEYADGFLIYRWQEGHLMRNGAGGSPEFLEALCRYLTIRVGRFRTGKLVDTAPLGAMLLQNAQQGLGENPPGLAAAARQLEALPAREAVIADGRLQLREWLLTPAGYVKVDAWDHGDDLRFPGPADAAWDLAGAAVEYALEDTTLGELTRRCARAAGDAAGELREAVAAYRAPYAACCFGEAFFSALESPIQEDKQRLDAEAERYRSALSRELRRWS
ncbi:MAG TPA: hypothetical protein VGR27_00020 [Longimicrobiaceae bacterium]|nr:hypothetical protein [Longimicrobiaceae bacterium]